MKIIGNWTKQTLRVLFYVLGILNFESFERKKNYLENDSNIKLKSENVFLGWTINLLGAKSVG